MGELQVEHMKCKCRASNGVGPYCSLGFIGWASTIFFERFSEKLMEEIFSSITVTGQLALVCNVAVIMLAHQKKVA